MKAKKLALQTSLRVQVHTSPSLLQQTLISSMPTVKLEQYLWDLTDHNPFLQVRYKSFQSPLFSNLNSTYQDMLETLPQQKETQLDEMREELLGMRMSGVQKWIGETLITALLPDGTMSVSLESVASYVGVSEQDVRYVFEKLQDIFPIIREFSSNPIVHFLQKLFPNSEDFRIALRYWEILQKWVKKSQGAFLSPEILREESRKEISRQEQNPRIFSILDTMDSSLEELIFARELFGRSSNQESVVIKPDVHIVKEGQIFQVKKMGELLFELSTIQKPKGRSETLLWRQVKDLLATLQRQETFFLQLVHFLVQAQSGFFTGERETPVPFYQKELAQHFKVHPSTVSRTLKDKTFLFEGQVYPLSILVDKPSKGKGGKIFAPKNLMREIEDILKHTQGYRITDEKMREFLEHRNIHIARKTVNKYRRLVDASFKVSKED